MHDAARRRSFTAWRNGGAFNGGRTAAVDRRRHRLRLLRPASTTTRLVKKWLGILPGRPFPSASPGRIGHDEYTHYYYSQAMYILGEKGYEKLFPNSKPEDRLTWSKYKEEMFKHLADSQAADGELDRRLHRADLHRPPST